MILSKLLKQHPCLTQAEEMRVISNPLKKIGITYFGHALVDEDGKVSGLSNHAEFFYDYLKTQSFNIDVHCEPHINRFNHIHWDFINTGPYAEYCRSKEHEFNIYHLFTIVKVIGVRTHCYHFATDKPTDNMNHFYLTHIELLERFIDYYHHKLNQNKLLNQALAMHVPIQNVNLLETYPDLTLNENCKNSYLNELVDPLQRNHSQLISLPDREHECAYYLIDGLSTKEIAKKLNISPRTVEVYFERLKKRFGSKNKFQLVRHILENKVY